MSEQNKATIHRFWEEVFNGRKLDIIDEIFTADYVEHGSASQEIRGTEALRQTIGMHFNASPDVNVEIEDVFGREIRS